MTKTVKELQAERFTVDVRHLTVGQFLGGAAGRVACCDVCGLGAIRLTDALRKDGYHKRFAHRLTLSLNARLEPVATYDERHVAPEPHRARLFQAANENGDTPHAL